MYSCPAFQKMHTARSPCSIPTGVPGDALDLSLSGSQLSMSRRPSSASPGKYFSRSVSMSVASESRGKRNTLVRKLWNSTLNSSCDSVTQLFYFSLLNCRAMPVSVAPVPSRTWDAPTAPLRSISRPVVQGKQTHTHTNVKWLILCFMCTRSDLESASPLVSVGLLPLFLLLDALC